MASIDATAVGPKEAVAVADRGIRLKHLLSAIAGIAVLMSIGSQATGRTAWLLQIPAALVVGLAISLVHRSRVIQAAVRFYVMPTLLILTMLVDRAAHPGILGSLMALITALLTAAIVCLTFVDRLTAAHAHDRSRKPGVIMILAALLGLIAPFGLALSPWPLDVGFAISRPGLEDLADRAVAGKRIHWPIRVGAFTVFGAEVDRKTGNVGLILDPYPGGRTGLSRRPPGGSAPGPFFNLNADRDLGHGWRFQEED